jgi:hypothetical protein
MAMTNVNSTSSPHALSASTMSTSC